MPLKKDAIEQQMKEEQGKDTPQEKIQEHHRYLEVLKFEFKQKNELFKIFTNNCLAPEFKYSTRAGLALIFVPTAINTYYLYRPHAMFKNAFRIGTVIGCYANFIHNLRADFAELVKQDNPIANKARQHFQNLAIVDPSVPAFEKETEDVASERKIKAFELTLRNLQEHQNKNKDTEQ